jgi:hypothetical protein
MTAEISLALARAKPGVGSSLEMAPLISSV